MNKSPQRNTFQKEGYLKRCEEKGEEPNADYLDYFQKILEQQDRKFNDPKSRENNLEYDLRSNQWICDKAKASEAYAQNIYAALCNQSWQRNEVWPRLQDQVWSCSWRYAGGIVADMREQGDYIDWYCSGIRGGDEPQVYESSPLPTSYVPEGTVTEEIQQDFFRLGWIPAVDNQDE